MQNVNSSRSCRRYNVVDCAYLKEKGIPVSNIPAYSAMGVAQLVFAFISELAVGVALHSDAVKNGEWSNCPDFCFWKKPLTELSGKTIGIVGFGKIGGAVARHSRGLQNEHHSAVGSRYRPERAQEFQMGKEPSIMCGKRDNYYVHCPTHKRDGKNRKRRISEQVQKNSVYHKHLTRTGC